MKCNIRTSRAQFTVARRESGFYGIITWECAGRDITRREMLIHGFSCRKSLNRAVRTFCKRNGLTPQEGWATQCAVN